MSGLLLLQAALAVSAWSVFLTQLVRTRRSTAGLALATWAGFVAGGTAWIIYGLTVGDPLQLWVNVPTGVVSLLICRAAWPDAGPAEQRRALVVAGVVLTASLLASGGLGVLGAATVAIALSFVQLAPQLVAVVRRADVEGVSVAAWTILGGNQLGWLTYGLLESQPAVVVNASFVSVASFVIAGVTRWRGEQVVTQEAVEAPAS